MRALLAAVCAALATWVLVPPGPRVRRTGRGWWVLVPVVPVVAWLGAGSAGLVWILMAGAVVGTVGVVVRRQRNRAASLHGGREVARATRALAGRLSVGEIPAVALARVADDVEILSHARRTQEVGGSVPEALVATASRPGASGLVGLAHAWRLCESAGAPLAPAARSVAEGTARRARLEATLESELAAPRASGRVMGLLPLLGLAMGHMVGARPVEFLTGTWPGRACLLGAVVLACAGVLWSEWLADRVSREALP